MILFFDFSSILSCICKAKKKFGIGFSASSIDGKPLTRSEVIKACPTLGELEYIDYRIFATDNQHRGFILFDTKAEWEKAYFSTVGDDGPTATNKYKGPVRVYAITCNNKGKLMGENT